MRLQIALFSNLDSLAKFLNADGMRRFLPTSMAAAALLSVFALTATPVAALPAECEQSGGTSECKPGTVGVIIWSISSQATGAGYGYSFDEAVSAYTSNVVGNNPVVMCSVDYVGPYGAWPDAGYKLGVQSSAQGYLAFDDYRRIEGTCQKATFPYLVALGNWVADVYCEPGFQPAADGSTCVRPIVKDCDKCGVGNPISPASGAKVQYERDFQGAGPFPLSFERTYNSQGFIRPGGDAVGGIANGGYSGLGILWRHNYQRRVHLVTDGSVPIVYVVGPTGAHETFKKVGAVWTPPSFSTELLTELFDTGGVRSGWRHTTSADVVELYDASGKLLSITDRSGLTQTLDYSDGTAAAPNGATAADTAKPIPVGMLIRVTDSFGRTLSFTYRSDLLLIKVTGPSNDVYLISYDGLARLKTVTYPDSKSRTYVYYKEEQTVVIPASEYLLSGIIDENNVRFATFGYDTQRRAISTEHAGGQEKFVVS